MDDQIKPESSGHIQRNLQANIYRWLKEQGFGMSQTDDRVLTFRRTGEEILPVSVISMKRNFLDFLEAAAFDSFDGEKKRTELIDWFFAMPPLKQNELFRLHLSDTLSPEEMDRIHAA